MTQPAKVPRVFISYSHDTPQHKANALALTQALRKTRKIDAWIDQFDEEAPPHSWPIWMLDQLDQADFVIMICTDMYKRRAYDQERPGAGYGARWEGALIAQSIYSQTRFTETSPYLPVVFNHDDLRNIPLYVAGATHYEINPETLDGIDGLIARVLGVRTVIPYPLSGQEAADKHPQPVEHSVVGKKVLGEISQRIANEKGASPAEAAQRSKQRRWLRDLLDQQLPQEANDVKDRMVYLLLNTAEAELASGKVDDERMYRLIRRVHIEALETVNKWRADARPSDSGNRPAEANAQDVRYLVETHFPNIGQDDLQAMRKVLSGINRQQLNAMMSDAETMRQILDQLRENRRR